MTVTLKALPAAICLLSVLLLSASFAHAAATITILNADPAGIGFNDPNTRTPVGGNTGITLGQQRLNAFQAAANIWGATLTSNQTIVVSATWEALSCTSNAAVLGSAGSNGLFRDFPGAPFAGTWYVTSLANKMTNSDLNGATTEIRARFNINLGNAGCLEGFPFYLGLDNNHGNAVDLVAVLLHEFSHGLGFSTTTNANTGTYNSGFPSIYDRFLVDGTTGRNWLFMTDAERAASALSGFRLAWNGPQAVANAPAVLTGGTDSLGKPLMYAPDPFESGSSVSHWSTLASPNQLMEPQINFDLTHNVMPPSDLTYSQLRDIGWVANPLPSSIAVSAGNGQRVPLGGVFGRPFQVTVSPAISGIQVTWTINPTGSAGATFTTTGTRFAVTTTDALGVATSPPIIANAFEGNYSMVGTAPGAGSTTFALRSFSRQRHP